MSPLPWPAAVRTSGTAAIGPGWVAPVEISLVTASATDGRDSSMNPPSTAGIRPAARAATRSTNRVNSATPAVLRVPWPTISRGGLVTGQPPGARDPLLLGIGPTLGIGPAPGGLIPSDNGSWGKGRRAGRVRRS